MKYKITLLMFGLWFSSLVMGQVGKVSHNVYGIQVKESINRIADQSNANLSNINNLQTAVNVIDYGAVGDGKTDDWGAFQTALDSAASQGRELIIPAGTYRIDSEIEVRSFDGDHPCYITGEGRVLLDFSNVTASESAFELHSAYDAEYVALDYDLSQGDTLVVSSALASIVNRGDVLEIKSDSLWGRTIGIYKREMVKVRRSSNDTIFLYTPLYDNYESDGTNIKNLNAAILRIENIELIGNPSNQAQTAFTLSSFRDVYIKNVTTRDFYGIGFFMTKMYGGGIYDCTATEQLRAGFGYGISLQVCQSFAVSNCRIYGARHAVEMGLTTRSVVVEKCHVYAASDYDYPMDCHESCEYLTWRDNYVYGGGFYLRGLNYSLDNNRIFMTKTGGAAIGLVMYGYAPRVNDYIDITNNKVINLGGSGYYAIQAKFWHNSDTIRNMIIANNQFTTGSHGIFFNTDDSDTDTVNVVEKLLLSNNYVNCETEGKDAIYISDSIQYKLIKVEGGTYISEGLGLVFGGAEGSDKIMLSDVYVEADGNRSVSTNNGRYQDFYMRDCHVVSPAYVWVDVAGEAVMFGNVIEDATEKSGIYVERASQFTYDQNLFINCTGSVDDNATATNTGVSW